MSAIRYVCLSDTHFGQNDGLLTNLTADGNDLDVTQPSLTLRALCDGLRALLAETPDTTPPPTLILNGDILETAFTTLNQAAMAFERFVELAFPDQGEPLFGRVIFVPGNHDHHLWEMARETQYVNHMLRSKAGETELDVPWHTTNMLVENDEHPLTSYFLNNLIRRHGHPHLEGLEVEVAYPNFGLHRADLSRAVLFHHGHFAEKIYHLLSEAADALFPGREPPLTVWDVEAENFAWIDFFWGCLGRSGRVGPLVQDVYNSLGYEAARDKLLANLAQSLAEKHDLPGWGDKMEALILRKGLQQAADWLTRHERSGGGSGSGGGGGGGGGSGGSGAGDGIPLSDACREGLEQYLSGPLWAQLLGEVGRLDQPPPDQVIFSFGHTHRPYQALQRIPQLDRTLPVYNTGGWVVETVDPSPVHGATALLLDNDLNAAGLHLYTGDDFDVRVVDADTDHTEDNPLGDHVRHALQASREAWLHFADTIQAEITVRAEARARRLAEQG